VSASVVITDEFDRDGVGSRGAAVLEGEQESVTLADEISGRIGPSVQVGAAAKRLTELGARALAHVVDDGDGGVVFALQMPQEAEQRGHFAGTVFVDLVQAHERVEQNQPWPQGSEGGVETALVVLGVEPQARGGDHMQVESVDVETTVLADSSDAAADLMQGILGEVDEGRAGLLDIEAVEAGCVAGDGDGEVESEPAFAGLRSPCNESNSLVSPQRADEPGRGPVDLLQVGDASRRQ
jgi:hypothetical protein